MKIKHNCIAIIIFLLIPNLLNAAIYYVDATNGNDTNNGLSEALAWKTIAKVNAKAFQPGDQILFKKGELWREELKPRTSGTSTKPTTFSTYGAGNKPIILGSEEARGIDSDWSSAGAPFDSHVYKRSWAIELGAFDGNPNWGSVIFNQSKVGKNTKRTNSLPAAEYDFYYDVNKQLLYVFSPAGKPSSYYSSIEASTRRFCVDINKANYIVVDGLELRQSGEWLLQGSGNYGEFKNILFAMNWSCGPNISGHYNQVHDCEVTNTSGIGQGITVSGNYNKIYKNNVHHNFQEGIQLQMGAGYNEVYNNVVYNNGAVGIYVECSHDAKVHHNLIHNNKGWAIGVVRETLTYENPYNVDIYYNVSYKDGEGIRLGDLTGQATLSNIKIYNNTIYDPVDKGIRATSVQNTTYINCVIKNNIVYLSNNTGEFDCALSIWNPSGFTINNNCYYRANQSYPIVIYGSIYYTPSTFNDYISISGQDNYSIIKDPIFTNISNNDFSLKKDSPCIDAGIFIGATIDFIGNKVPQGEKTDIGAFEYKKADLIPPQNFKILSQ